MLVGTKMVVGINTAPRLKMAVAIKMGVERTVVAGIKMVVENIFQWESRWQWVELLSVHFFFNPCRDVAFSHGLLA